MKEEPELVRSNGVLECARRVLSLEAKTVAAQTISLDEQFVELVGYLVETDGNVFVTGIGKSGLVARSLASKLASVGICAVFLSATDALHGEIGVLRNGDLVILVSNSGTTEEVIEVGKAAAQRGARLAAIVSRIPSPLSGLADWTIRVHVEREADETRLPTASTIAMLALSDALAISAADGRGFTVEEFSRNHPGGSLGMLLSSKIDDLMMKAPDQVALVRPEDLSLSILAEMTKYTEGTALVTGVDQRLLGIVTDGDIRRGISKYRKEFMSLTARSLMTTNPLTCRSGTLAIEALEVMETNSRQVYMLPVVDAEDIVVGLLRMHDIATLNLTRFRGKQYE